MSFLSRTRIRPSASQGFTLMELMVSIGIMAFISTIVIGSQSQYTSGASLKNVANDLSLSLRQAQVYGVSVREFTPGSNTFNIGYGVAFDTSPAPSGDAEAFIFFADRDVDGTYGDGWDCPLTPSSECLDKTTLSQGNRVSDLCIITDLGESCDDIDRLDISFVRPATEAKIYYNGGSTGVKGARIELSSLEGDINSVVVYSTGQISVR